VKRIDIYYGGEHYSVGGRELADLQADIAASLAAGGGWLTVNDGEGAHRTAFLLIAPGVPIAVVPVPQERADGTAI
jgi:hypothetical protein